MFRMRLHLCSNIKSQGSSSKFTDIVKPANRFNSDSSILLRHQYALRSIYSIEWLSTPPPCLHINNTSNFTIIAISQSFRIDLSPWGSLRSFLCFIASASYSWHGGLMSGRCDRPVVGWRVCMIQLWLWGLLELRMPQGKSVPVALAWLGNMERVLILMYRPTLTMSFKCRGEWGPKIDVACFIDVF